MAFFWNACFRKVWKAIGKWEEKWENEMEKEVKFSKKKKKNYVPCTMTWDRIIGVRRGIYIFLL